MPLSVEISTENKSLLGLSPALFVYHSAYVIKIDSPERSGRVGEIRYVDPSSTSLLQLLAELLSVT